MNDYDSPENKSGGTTRRRFLGAAAAAAGLTALSGTTTASEAPDAEAIIDEQWGPDDDPYTVTDCGSVPGELGDIQVATDMADGPIEVDGIYEPRGWSGVGLKFTTDAVNIGTSINPDAARDLAKRLLVAADAAEGKHGDQ